eukprot:gnl/Trimastix_PCT/3435.p1 GENE.gnl/Trimastix_PCT/3435~~gnl/Trimastix_PCT/3435.p1  ORF type:complete len:405 (-),score=30.51 gnl/Trimastix_PCT/3435:47-1261(-)
MDLKEELRSLLKQKSVQATILQTPLHSSCHVNYSVSDSLDSFLISPCTPDFQLSSQRPHALLISTMETPKILVLGTLTPCEPSKEYILHVSRIDLTRMDGSQASMHESHILNLPRDILLSILGYCSPRIEYHKFVLSCSYFRDLILRDSEAQRHLIRFLADHRGAPHVDYSHGLPHAMVTIGQQQLDLTPVFNASVFVGGPQPPTCSDDVDEHGFTFVVGEGSLPEDGIISSSQMNRQLGPVKLAYANPRGVLNATRMSYHGSVRLTPDLLVGREADEGFFPSWVGSLHVLCTLGGNHSGVPLKGVLRYADGAILNHRETVSDWGVPLRGQAPSWTTGQRRVRTQTEGGSGAWHIYDAVYPVSEMHGLLREITLERARGAGAICIFAVVAVERTMESEHSCANR